MLSVFPIGLVAIILTGAELVTSNMCICKFLRLDFASFEADF